MLSNALYPWQAAPWQALISRLETQTFPHALLLAGPKGLGKRAFAEQLAARLLCQSPEGFACGTCQSCFWLSEPEGAHPDFFRVQPEEEGSAIKVEQIRELLDSLAQTAQTAWQVVLIAPAEAMNKAAANAMLKTLEEPNGQVVFLLVSDQPGSVPATIRSRCQKIDFRVPPRDQSLVWLRENEDAETGALRGELLLSLAENIPLRAQALAEPARWAAHEQLLEQFLKLMQHQITPLQMAANCADQDWQPVFEDLSLLLLDLVRLQQLSTASIANTHLLQPLTRLAAQLPTAKIFGFLDGLFHIRRTRNQKVSLNSLLAWENLFVELQGVVG